MSGTWTTFGFSLGGFLVLTLVSGTVLFSTVSPSGINVSLSGGLVPVLSGWLVVGSGAWLVLPFNLVLGLLGLDRVVRLRGFRFGSSFLWLRGRGG